MPLQTAEETDQRLGKGKSLGDTRGLWVDVLADVSELSCLVVIEHDRLPDLTHQHMISRPRFAIRLQKMKLTPGSMKRNRNCA